MNAAEVIKAANKDGITLSLSTNGTIKYAGKQDAVARFLPLLRQYKTEIIKALNNNVCQAYIREKKPATAPRPLPPWCQADCPWRESIRLPGEGETPGCANEISWPGEWRRLDRMTACPARKRLPVLPLPEWCSRACERHVRLDMPGGGVIEWCVEWTDAKHWSYTRIDAMNGCPRGQDRRD